MHEEEIEWLALELERRRLMEPLRFFKPNGAQAKFIETIKKDDSEICVFPAGNWTGKTAAALVVLATAIWPEHAENKIFQHPLFQKWPFPKAARILTTPKEMSLTGSIQKEIKRWFPAGQYKSEKMGKMYPSIFVAKDWTIDTMTYDQALTEFEGGTIGLFILNEPPPEDIFDTCSRRMKFGGKILLPATPLTNAAWIWDRLVAQDGKTGIYVVYGRTEDNCIEHGVNGVIPHKAIENMSNKCADEDERQACLEGKFMHLAGCIFKGFKCEVHVIPESLVELADKEIYMVCDPAIGKPLFVIWAAIGTAGDITIYDEWPNFEFNKAKDPNYGVAEYAEQFKIKEVRVQGKPIQRILDRHFGNARRTLGGLTLKQEFSEVGIDFMDSYTISEIGAEVETGILKVKDALRYNDKKPIDALNQPKLRVSDNCTNTIHALERWSRDPKTGKPKEEYKDGADVVRYLVMSNPEVCKPVDWNIESLSYGVNNQ